MAEDIKDKEMKIAKENSISILMGIMSTMSKAPSKVKIFAVLYTCNLVISATLMVNIWCG